MDFPLHENNKRMFLFYFLFFWSNLFKINLSGNSFSNDFIFHFWFKKTIMLTLQPNLSSNFDEVVSCPHGGGRLLSLHDSKSQKENIRINRCARMRYREKKKVKAWCARVCSWAPTIVNIIAPCKHSVRHPSKRYTQYIKFCTFRILFFFFYFTLRSSMFVSRRKESEQIPELFVRQAIHATPLKLFFPLECLPKACIWWRSLWEKNTPHHLFQVSAHAERCMRLLKVPCVFFVLSDWVASV